MTLQDFTKKLASPSYAIGFTDTMSVIEELYTFTPTAFSNGDITNNADQNNGSCKLFAFAKDQGLSKENTLSCFGDYYTKDVLKNPDGTDHQNIRNFMQYGWDGIKFTSDPLQKK